MHTIASLLSTFMLILFYSQGDFPIFNTISVSMTKAAILEMPTPDCISANGDLHYELSSCRFNVSLTWTPNDDMIEFKCRVNLLKFSLKFCNQFDKKVASCMFPINGNTTDCTSHFKNSSIVQDLKTNITTLIVRGHINNKVNGPWSCYHGTNTGNATVIVTGWIDKSNSSIPLLKSYFEDKRCWQEYSSWTFAGMLCTSGMSCIVYLIYKCCCCKCRGVGDFCKGILEKIEKRSKRRKTCIKVTIVLVCFGVLIIPLVCGIIESGPDCTHQEAFLVCGFGIIPFLATLAGKTKIPIQNNTLMDNSNDYTSDGI